MRGRSAAVGRRAAVRRSAAAGLALAALSCGRADRVPAPPSDDHRAAVTAFFVGLAAAEVGLDRDAEARWLEVVRLAPGEPATWANLAMLASRRNEPDLAAERMGEALRLAPEDADVRHLAGLVEIARGDGERARAELLRAAELEPGHLRTLFALAELAERSRGADAEREAQQWLGRVLAHAPDNLAARVRLLRIAARRGDRGAVAREIERLRREAAAWPPAARERLTAVEDAAAGDPAAAAIAVALLENVLAPVPEHRESLEALRPAAGASGVLIERPLALAAPREGPAPADAALAFEVEALAGDAPGLAFPIQLDAAGPPVLAVVTETSVSIEPAAPAASAPGGPSFSLPAPGGAVPSRNALLAATLDNRLLADLVFAGPAGLRIFEQDEEGSFSDASARLPGDVIGTPATGVWALDFDLEGDLDLVVATTGGPPTVLVRQADGGFAPGPTFAGAAGVRDLVWADLDRDGDPDVAILQPDGAVRVYYNRGATRYDEAALPPVRAKAITVAEIDGDDALDLLYLADDGSIRRMTPPPGAVPGSAGDAAATPSAEPLVSWPGFDPSAADARLFAADLDNNGCVDVVASANGAGRAWLCGADLRPAARTVAIDGAPVGAADLDGDGRLDLVGRTRDGRPARFHNRGRAPYGWLALRPRAAEFASDQRVNALGLGGEVEVRSGLLYQKRAIDGGVIHVGLGERESADVTRIVWPNGLVQVDFALRSEQTIVVRQRIMGSCPWLFAFDGEGMAFVTDVLWRSPLGMRAGGLGTIPVPTTRDGFRIRGDQLAPRQGAYDLRITTELWETFYVDHVSLIVVDHPAGTAVHLDERFALPPPDLSVRTTGPPQPVAGAWDDRGREVTDLVRARDGRHLGVPGPGVHQGITRDHFVEIDLGPHRIGREGLVLLATGWIRPMDSSVSIARSQGGTPPRSLAIEVPDGRGGWTLARADLGFPAGKNKTIVLDLEEVLPEGGPARLRLTTNLEIFWDAIEWAVARPDVPLRQRRIDLSAAELHFRGFSTTAIESPSSPEIPRYLPLDGTGPRWRDAIGYYTRFGEVRELLDRVDDRYVIMNAGDELQLRFPAPPPPPAGWVRDFVFVNDGWGKGPGYNNEFSDTVLPLPSHDRPAYDEPPGRLEDDPVYRRHPQDWARFHTRYVTTEPFRRALVVE